MDTYNKARVAKQVGGGWQEIIEVEERHSSLLKDLGEVLGDVISGDSSNRKFTSQDVRGVMVDHFEQLWFDELNNSYVGVYGFDMVYPNPDGNWVSVDTVHSVSGGLSIGVLRYYKAAGGYSSGFVGDTLDLVLRRVRPGDIFEAKMCIVIILLKAVTLESFL